MGRRVPERAWVDDDDCDGRLVGDGGGMESADAASSVSGSLSSSDLIKTRRYKDQ